MNKSYVKNSNIHCSVVEEKRLPADLKHCDEHSDNIIERDNCYFKASEESQARIKKCIES